MTDTITAIVTPPGMGGVGIVRVSGDMALAIAQKILRDDLKPRHVWVGSFVQENGDVVDHGCALFFKGPHSFTGEDVVEFQGHGGVAIMQALLNLTIYHGARQAEAGEFTKRAYLNGKIDLAQAEAVADMIHAATQQAAKAAMQSLQGKFSEQVHHIAQAIQAIRVQVEAHMDFSDEAIDFKAYEALKKNMQDAIDDLQSLLKRARKGVISQQGFSLVLAGLPNAGKSSLYNQLIGEDRAIVTEIPGTTRDALTHTINLQGIPVNLIDTAGLRDSDDPVEQVGVQRTKLACGTADCILWVVDLSQAEWPSVVSIREQLGEACDQAIVVVGNKVDLLSAMPKPPQGDATYVCCSSLKGTGIDELAQSICQVMGMTPDESDTLISARQRHCHVLEKAMRLCQQAMEECDEAPECAAESLRLAHQTLGTITGVVSADAMLGEIFSTFCIGK